jgi:hypothetical protein
LDGKNDDLGPLRQCEGELGAETSSTAGDEYDLILPVNVRKAGHQSQNSIRDHWGISYRTFPRDAFPLLKEVLMIPK